MAAVATLLGGDEDDLGANVGELFRQYPEVLAEAVGANANARHAVAAMLEFESLDVRMAFTAAVWQCVTRLQYVDFLRPMAAEVEAVVGFSPLPLAAARAAAAAAASMPPQPRAGFMDDGSTVGHGWESMGISVRVSRIIDYMLQWPELRKCFESEGKFCLGLKVFIDAAMVETVT